MVRSTDNKEREKDILNLVIDSYIKESKPISSAYLCEKHNLNCSTATIRNILVSLEKQGFLSHIHTSSGRVPTKEGFKYYVNQLSNEEEPNNYPVNLSFYAPGAFTLDNIVDNTLDVLTRFSGYTSLMAISGRDERLFFRGVRCILDQPEFEDIRKLKDVLYTLEVRMDELSELLFDCIDNKISVLIGDDIGFSEISDCSLVVAGLRAEQLVLAVALLGPMRMDYLKARSCLCSIKNRLGEIVQQLTIG